MIYNLNRKYHTGIFKYKQYKLNQIADAVAIIVIGLSMADMIMNDMMNIIVGDDK